MRFGSITERTLFAVISIALVTWGFFDGLSLVNRTVEIFFLIVQIRILDALYSNIAFTVTTVFASALLYREIYSTSYIGKTTDAGRVEAVIPVYKDAGVLENSVNTLKNSNYNDIRINVVCEEEDEESIETAENLDCEVVINKHPGSKAGAINTVFEMRDSEYYALFDADEKIDKDFIPHAVKYLEEGYEVFQGRRIPIPNGAIEKFAYCERAIFHAAYKLQGLLGFIHAKTSSTVLTKETWKKVDGFDDMLTEDIDFSHKCYRQNIKVKTDRRHTNLMEAPHSLKDFWEQRKRWLTGTVQIFHKGLKRNYKEGPLHREAFSVIRSFVSFTFPILILIFFSNFLVLVILGLQLFYSLPILATSLAPLLLSYKDSKIDEIDFIGWFAFTTFLLMLFSGLIALKSILEYVFTWEGEWYLVEKGE